MPAADHGRESRKILLFLATVFLCAAALAQSREAVIRAAVIEDFPPLYHIDYRGKPEGMAIDILAYVSRETGLRFETIMVKNWAEADQAIRAGKADIVPGIGLDDERAEEFAFSSIPMETVPISVFVRSGTSAIGGPADLIGRHTAVLKDGVAWSILRKDSANDLLVCENVDEAIMALLSGEVDALACPEPMLMKKLQEIRLSSRISPAGKPLAELKRYYMFRKEDEGFFKDTFDAALKVLTSSSEYRRIYERWYGEPEPFLTAERVAWGAGIAIAALALGFIAVWTVTVGRNNRRLKKALAEEESAERALEESEERFRTLFESAPLGVIVAAGPDFTVRYANSAFLRMFGYDVSEVGKFSAAALATERGMAAVAAFAARAGADERAFAENASCARKDGSILYCDIFAAPMRVEGAAGTVGFFIDASEREKTREELRQTEKMAAIGQLAGGIAHDFNNQLAGISGYAEILSDKCSGNTETGRLIDGILTAVRRSADLTMNLLAFARKGKFEEQDVDMGKIAEEVRNLVSRSIDKRISIAVTSDCGGLVARGDPSQLQNALLNLVINARDAMEQGGAISLSCQSLRLSFRDSDWADKGMAPGTYLRIAVKDDGKGMGPEVLSHAFEPFFTTKDPGKGTGMGLAAVYGTVRNHNGAVRIESEVGAGTIVEILLPAFEPAISPTLGQAENGDMPGKRRRILLVDDEESIRAVSGEMLAQAGMEIELARDGKEAVQAFRTAKKPFDAVILDLMMPGLSGAEAFAQIRAGYPDAAIVITSGYSIDGEAQALLDAGARSFLHKPFRRAELLKAVLDALG
jgi:two-component system, cell cycle sensor histidine kinase and response regulator CckA